MPGKDRRRLSEAEQREVYEKVKKQIAGGTPREKACKEAGISSASYQNYKRKFDPQSVRPRRSTRAGGSSGPISTATELQNALLSIQRRMRTDKIAPELQNALTTLIAQSEEAGEVEEITREREELQARMAEIESQLKTIGKGRTKKAS